MKKKLFACFLMLTLVIGSTSALAAPKINSVNLTAGAGATLSVENDGKSIAVNYKGAKGNQYVVMVVAEDAVDANGVPTKDSIGNNQNHEVIYMDQAEGGNDGSVKFNVYPDLSNASGGDKFNIFLSGTGLNMSKLGDFTLDELLRWLGDVNGDDKVDIQDVQRLLNNLIDEIELTGNDFTAANVNNTDTKITIADVQRLLNMIIDEEPKKSI